MLESLKKILGLSPKADYKELVEKGAQLIDVRTPKEFELGHIEGSVNIPLQVFKDNLSQINNDKPVIVFCKSGARSGIAKRILKSNNFTPVYNAGGWESLQEKIK